MFITFEGTEGAGKTTQIRHISEFLQNKGYHCVMTREPGSTKIGKKIRTILLDPDNNDMDSLTELLLYMADRVQHINKVVIPSLSEGKTVLCDRYSDATLVYQGFARGINIELIKKLHRLILDDLKPDMTFLLDLPPEIGLSRAWKQIENGIRTKLETRFEKETLAFHKKVREGYLALARLEPERFRIIDASVNENQVQREIIKNLSLFLFREL
ncbi:dTMP kinase [Desulfonema magnum]|uniref:Thymidylate kinase n=1 Tax=Desulfonema magnum TaxID=45655 RepID=A0A975BUE9_9BACT|nr:dTMP kinase [Desulfonema magnum]QTA91951.1 Thymidylate kinase [Desulfonema magnum]